MSSITLDAVHQEPLQLHKVRLSRVVGVELRKMFDTRAGFWLMASILIAALVSTVATILFAPESDLTYYTC